MLNPIAQRQLQELRQQYGSGPELARQLAAELNALAGVVRRADGEGWTQVMPGREWTPAQEAEHIVLSNEGTARVIRLLLSDKELRPGPAVYAEYRADGRRLAPASVQPTGNISAQELLARNEALLQALNVNVSESSERVFFHPAFGPIDALDWLKVTAWHTRQHRQAMQAALAANIPTQGA